MEMVAETYINEKIRCLEKCDDNHERQIEHIKNNFKVYADHTNDLKNRVHATEIKVQYIEHHLESIESKLEKTINLIGDLKDQLSEYKGAVAAKKYIIMLMISLVGCAATLGIDKLWH